MARGRTDWFGARLPIAPTPKPSKEPCDLGHLGGIRFELHRYGRKVGAIRLCGPCIGRFLDTLPPDPLTVDEAA